MRRSRLQLPLNIPSFGRAYEVDTTSAYHDCAGVSSMHNQIFPNVSHTRGTLEEWWANIHSPRLSAKFSTNMALGCVHCWLHCYSQSDLGSSRWRLRIPQMISQYHQRPPSGDLQCTSEWQALQQSFRTHSDPPLILPSAQTPP